VKGGRNALLGSIPSTNPDFLWSLVGSLHFMRLSLKKGAHVVLSRAAYRKSGESTGAPPFALFAKGGMVRSHPLTPHGKQTCSLGDLEHPLSICPRRNHSPGGVGGGGAASTGWASEPAPTPMLPGYWAGPGSCAWSGID
jgi:hypothetical protein